MSGETSRRPPRLARKLVYVPEGEWQAPLNFSGVTCFLGRALERQCASLGLGFEVVDTSFVVNTEELALLVSADAQLRERGLSRLRPAQASHSLTHGLLVARAAGQSAIECLRSYDAGCQRVLAGRLSERAGPLDFLLSVNPLNPPIETDLSVYYYLDTLLAEFYFDGSYGVLRELVSTELSAYFAERERAALRRARKIWVWSESGAACVRQATGLGELQVAVLPAGANVEHFPDWLERSFEGELRVLFVGRNLAFKGRDCVEHVAANLPAGVSLTVVTERAFHPLRSQPGVRYLPVMEREAVLRAYAEHDLFLFPTKFDPYGLVVCEAMAYSLPVLASATRAVPEILGEDRRQLVSPAEPQLFSSRLAELAKNRDALPAISLANYRRAREHFDWQRIARTLLDGLLR